MSGLRWALLGWGKIARTQLYPALLAAGHRVTVVGSRAPGGLHLAEAGGARWLDYQAAIEDHEVDAVCIALPNHAHVPWSLRALQAGKPVLCEKPMALSLRDAREVFALARERGLHMQEGFMVRHHPQWQAMRERVARDLGPVHAIYGTFTYRNLDPANIRNQRDLGGGGLWDIGVYPILAGIWLMGREPDQCRLRVVRHPEWDTDMHSHGELLWGEGTVLQFHVSTVTVRQQMLRVVGERGVLQPETPFNPEPVTALRWQASEQGVAGTVQAERFGPVNQYANMFRDFALAVRGEHAQAHTWAEQSLAVSSTLERLWHSAASSTDSADDGGA